MVILIFLSLGMPLNFVSLHLVQFVSVSQFSFIYWPHNFSLYAVPLQLWLFSVKFPYGASHWPSFVSQLQQLIFALSSIPEQGINLSFVMGLIRVSLGVSFPPAGCLFRVFGLYGLVYRSSSFLFLWTIPLSGFMYRRSSYTSLFLLNHEWPIAGKP